MQKKFTMTFLAITLIAVMVIGMQIESVDAKNLKAHTIHSLEVQQKILFVEIDYALI